MAEKKVSTKKTAEAATEKKTCAKRTCAKKVVVLNAETVGFKAGDVYQALASAEGAPQTVAQIAKTAKISNEEALAGMGWLFKEGKIKEVEGKYTLA